MNIISIIVEAAPGTGRISALSDVCWATCDGDYLNHTKLGQTEHLYPLDQMYGTSTYMPLLYHWCSFLKENTILVLSLLTVLPIDFHAAVGCVVTKVNYWENLPAVQESSGQLAGIFCWLLSSSWSFRRGKAAHCRGSSQKQPSRHRGRNRSIHSFMALLCGFWCRLQLDAAGQSVNGNAL